MATIPVFLCFGNSNADGFGSFASTSTSDFYRWTGELSKPSTFPADVDIEGVRVWTPKLPATPATDYVITAKTATSVTLSGLSYSPGTHDDRWLYVKSATAGQGQYRKITNGSSATLDIGTAWTTEPTIGGTVEFLSESHTCDSGSSTTSVISVLSVGNPAGKWIVFISGALASKARRIVSGSSSTLTIEDALPVAPSSGVGFVICTTTAPVDGVSTRLAANGALRNMRFYQDLAYHYSTGYEYPNFKSYPYNDPNSLQHVGPYAFATRNEINWLPELAWQLRQKCTEPPVFVTLAIPSSSLGTQPIGTLSSLTGQYSWLNDITHLDWQPSSPNGLMREFLDCLDHTATALVAEGNEIDVQGIFNVVSDVDAASSVYANRVAENMTRIIQYIRDYIDTNGYSKKKASSIPWIMGNVAGTAWSAKSTVNAALEQIASDDPFVRVVDTSDYGLISDNVHWDHAAMVTFGQAAHDAWLAALTDESDATRVQEDLPTLASIRTAVLRRYERTITSNDSQNAQVHQFINDSLREIYNTLGDQAWFLRRMETLTLSSTYPATLNLPRKCKRLISVESTTCPGKQVTVKGIGYTDQGRIQVTLHDYSGTSYLVHYIVIPKDLEQDNDTTVLPQDYLEMLVTLTCKRLAEAGGNVSIASFFAAEVERLWKYVKRDVLRYDRMRLAQLDVSGSYDASFNGPAGPSSWRL